MSRLDAAQLPAALAPELAAAVGYAKAEKSEATRRAYGTDFRLFREWCDAKGASALPATPETVAAYLAHGVADGAKASTLGRRIAAIRYAHKLAGLPTPTDSEAVKAAARHSAHHWCRQGQESPCGGRPHQGDGSWMS